MNILHLIRSLDPTSGGTVESVRQLSAVHLQLGHHVELASLDQPGAAWLAGMALPCHALGPATGNYGYSPRLLPWLKERHKDFDLLVVNGLWQYHGLAAWRAFRAVGSAYVVVPHGMLDPWFKRQYPLKHLKKWLYWPWGEYRVLRDARQVIFTTEDERLLARESFWLYRAHELVAHLGIAPPPDDPAGQRAAFLAAHPQLSSGRNLLFLGRIHEKKGCDLLLAAFAAIAAQAPDLRLVMAGPDLQGLRPALHAVAERAGVAARVVWTGMLSGTLKWGALRCADAFILPSHQENFGISVVEALSCGVPALISDKVNIWREVQEDAAGLVANDDVAGTTALITRFLACDDAALLRLRQAAKDCFARRFQLLSSGQAMLQAYTKAISGPAHAAS
jgi:glycosyltransferase involved in cell wall biosynthesis